MALFSRKTEAVDHDIPSSISTGLLDAAKGAALGAGAFTIGGALIGAVTTGIPLAIVAGVIGGAFFSVGLPAALIAGGIGAVVGGMAGGGLGAGFSVVFAPVTGALAAIGGLLGLARGGARVSAEKAEFRRQAENIAGTRQQAMAKKLNDARIAGLQEGYVVGAQDAETRIAHQLQAMAMQQQGAAVHKDKEGTSAGGDFGAPAGMASAPAGAPVALAMAAASCDCTGDKKIVGDHTKKVVEGAAAAQAAAAAGVAPTV